MKDSVSAEKVVKPCPCCGDSAVAGPCWNDNQDQSGGFWWIECENCALSIELHGGDGYKSDDVITAWNRRSA